MEKIADVFGISKSLDFRTRLPTLVCCHGRCPQRRFRVERLGGFGIAQIQDWHRRTDPCEKSRYSPLARLATSLFRRSSYRKARMKTTSAICKPPIVPPRGGRMPPIRKKLSRKQEFKGLLCSGPFRAGAGPNRSERVDVRELAVVATGQSCLKSMKNRL